MRFALLIFAVSFDIMWPEYRTGEYLPTVRLNLAVFFVNCEVIL